MCVCGGIAGLSVGSGIGRQSYWQRKWKRNFCLHTREYNATTEWMKLRKLKVSRLRKQEQRGVVAGGWKMVGKGRCRGWRAKNSFPIKLYPFALIYRFHALSPLSTAELSGEKRAASRNPILKFSIFHFPLPSTIRPKKLSGNSDFFFECHWFCICFSVLKVFQDSDLDPKTGNG